MTLAGPVFAAELTYGDRDLIYAVMAICRVDLKLKECLGGVIVFDSEVLMVNEGVGD